MPDYLKQPDKIKKDQTKQAVDYFWKLVQKKTPTEKARQKVHRKTGVIL